MPIAGGVIIPVGRVAAFQTEPAFTITWIEGNSMNSFGTHRDMWYRREIAVSFLQGLSDYQYLLSEDNTCEIAC